MSNILAQFLPIILIFFIVSNNNSLFEFSNTILGKLLAIFIIIFYISIDTIIGLFVCALIILFYQSHYRENMDIIFSDLNNDYLDSNSHNDTGYLDDDYIDDYIYLYPKEEKKKKKIFKKNNKMNEGLEDKFRIDNCNNGILTFKNIKIKNEMSEFIFPQMKFHNRICNPCDETCKIIVDN
jgi:hypothetical protein